MGRRMLRLMGVGLTLAFLIGLTAPAAHAQELISITDVTGTVNRAGDVIVYATIVCAEPTYIYDADTRVTQPVGRTNYVRGYGDLDGDPIAECSSQPTVLAIPLQEYQGVFKPGTAQVDAIVFGCTYRSYEEGGYCDESEVNRSLRLTKA